MDIQNLHLLVTEADVNQLMDRFLPKNGPVENVRVRLRPEGIDVVGDYPTPLGKMGFETLWTVEAVGGQVHAHLAALKVAGVPAGLLRGVLLKTLRDVTAREPGVQIEDETVRINVEEALRAQGFPLRVYLTSVRCGPGSLFVEAGGNPADPTRSL
jgi:hypothetical protein